ATAHALLATAAKAPSAGASTATATTTARTKLGNHWHAGKCLGHPESNRLFRLIGDDHASSTIASGDELHIDLPLVHGIKEFDWGRLFRCVGHICPFVGWRFPSRFAASDVGCIAILGCVRGALDGAGG